MLQKTIENLRNLGKSALNKDAIVTEIKERTAGIIKTTSTEREKILDNLVDQLLKGEELGDNAGAIRSKVRERLFAKAEGDTLFLNNLKYINEVLTGSLPRSIAELTGFRSTLAHRLVEDARGGKVNAQPEGRREGGDGRGRRGDHRRGRYDRGGQGPRPNASGNGHESQAHRGGAETTHRSSPRHEERPAADQGANPSESTGSQNS